MLISELVNIGLRQIAPSGNVSDDMYIVDIDCDAIGGWVGTRSSSEWWRTTSRYMKELKRF